MSQDESWKKVVDRNLQQQRVMRKAEEERLKRQQEERDKAADRERQARIAEHIQQFKCHIAGCPNRSHGPSSYSRNINPHAGGTDGYREPYYISITKWNTPTGLSRCSSCQNWVCPIHIHNNICKFCYEVWETPLGPLKIGLKRLFRF